MSRFKRGLAFLCSVFAISTALSISYRAIVGPPPAGVVSVLVLVSIAFVLLCIAAGSAIWSFVQRRRNREVKPGKRTKGRKSKHATAGLMFVCFYPISAWCVPSITCAVTSPVANQELATVHVWVSPPNQPVKLQRNSTAGALEDVTPAINPNALPGQRDYKWDLRNRPVRLAQATFTVVDQNGATDTCTVEVILPRADQKGDANRLNKTSLLVKDQQEASGFGLYTYILFGSRLDEEMQKRGRKVVETFWRIALQLPSADAVSPNLNVVYFPVSAAPAMELSKQMEDPVQAGAWIIDHYDVHASSRILAAFGLADNVRGPYLVSALKPAKAGVQGRILFQDLSDSKVHDELITAWVERFAGAATRAQDWQPTTFERLQLTLANAVRIAADVKDPIRQSIVEWITVLGKLPKK